MNEVSSCLLHWLTMMTSSETASEGFLYSSPVLGTLIFTAVPALEALIHTISLSGRELPILLLNSVLYLIKMHGQVNAKN